MAFTLEWSEEALEDMVKSLNTTKSDLIRKAVVYYKDALEKERLKEQIKKNK